MCTSKRFISMITTFIHGFNVFTIPPIHSAALCSLSAALTSSRLRWASLWHLPSVPLLFTLLNVCACEHVGVCECESKPVCACVWLSSVTLIAANASESITIPSSHTHTTSFTFFRPCLKNISGGGIYFPSVPLKGLSRFQWVGKVAAVHRGRHFQQMKPKINRAVLSSHI